MSLQSRPRLAPDAPVWSAADAGPDANAPDQEYGPLGAVGTDVATPEASSGDAGADGSPGAAREDAVALGDPQPSIAAPAPVEAALEMASTPSARRGQPVALSRKGDSRSTARLLVVGAIVAVAGLGFAFGRTTAPASASGASGANGAFPSDAFGPGASGDPARFGGGAAIEGTVESVGSGTITVKLANGSTVQIATSASTTYHGQQAASASDVTAGQAVSVQVAAGAAASPGATSSAATASAPAASGAPTRTATDVTITGE